MVSRHIGSIAHLVIGGDSSAEGDNLLGILEEVGRPLQVDGHALQVPALVRLEGHAGSYVSNNFLH